MITEVPIFGFMKSRQTFYMLASVLPITHGRSVVNHAGPPATHNLCCVAAAAAADSRNTLQRSIFYFCYCIYTGFIHPRWCICFPSRVSRTTSYIYIYIVFGFLQFDLFVCQVYDSQTAVKHDWSCLSSPGGVRKLN